MNDDDPYFYEEPEPTDEELGWELTEVPVNYWGETTEEGEDWDYDRE